MNIELLILGGYGQFVWPAFIFTFLICLYLYLKTKKEFQKKEKIFIQEFNRKELVEEKVKEKKENTEEVLTGHSL